MNHEQAYKVLMSLEDSRIANLGIRSIFDGLCYEHQSFIKMDGLKKVEYLIEEKKISFKDLFIAYLDLAFGDCSRFYWLEGLRESLSNLTQLQCVSKYVFSFDWENILFEKQLKKKCKRFCLNTKMELYSIIERSFLDSFSEKVSLKKKVPPQWFF